VSISFFIYLVCLDPKENWIQGTKYRNAQLRYTQIVYCTLWEECKQTQCPHRRWRERTRALMWYYSPTKNKLIYQVRTNTNDFWLSSQHEKYNSNIFFFLFKNYALPLNSLFWSPPTAVHRFDASDISVPPGPPGLYISWLNRFLVNQQNLIFMY